MPANSYNVLLVEDEGLIAHDIARRVEALGHRVIATASTAAEAEEQAGAADIVLMDIHIDGPRDGIDAARQIRARYHIPVVFLTAHADRATLDRAKTVSPFGYIVKPVGPAVLQTSIELAVYKHRADRQLEEQEAWFRATIASVADALVVADPSGRVRALNRAAETLTGWTSTEAQGQGLDKIVRLMDEESGADAGDPVPLAILRGAPVTLDRGLRLVSRGGREFAVEGSASPVMAPPDTLGVVLSLRDVTGRRWEERQSRQAQRMEAAGRLAARVSGEYASLIEMIRNQAAQLLQQFGESSSARHIVEQIHQAAGAADHITRSLAGFGTRQTAQPEVLSLNAVLRRMAKLIESTAGPAVVTTLRPEPSCGRIKADVAQVEQAIVNLVLHAATRLPEGGRLTLETGRTEIPRASATGSYVVLSVDYTAAEPDLETLFDPAGTGQGGLALSVAHSIAVEHGGYLTARPTPEGTRLEMLLPRLNEEPLPQPVAKHRGEAPSVLLVDRRDGVRAQLHNFFESAGYNLLEASDPDEAVALGQMHDGALDLLIAELPEAQAILAEIQPIHPKLGALLIVDEPETSSSEIRRPFTQQALLERVESLLAARPKPDAALATSS